MNDIERVEILLTKLNSYILDILDTVFQQHYEDIISLVPVQYRYMISRGMIRRLVKGSRNVIMKLDPAIKREIAVTIRSVFDNVEDDYMHSVLRGKPDKDLGMLLQDMNQIHWNGI